MTQGQPLSNTSGGLTIEARVPLLLAAARVESRDIFGLIDVSDKDCRRRLACRRSRESPRRPQVEELWGEAKEEHGFRRFMRRSLANVRQEVLLIGWVLNLKRLAALGVAPG